MGKVKDLLIELENNKTSYYSGEVIAGYVMIQLSKPMEMEKLMLSFEGNGKSTNGTHCKEKIYFYDVTLFNGPKEHPMGEHQYKFNINLPQNLPSSIKMDNASIKYKLIVKVKYKSVLTKRWKIPINITEFIDANIREDPPVLDVSKNSSIFSNTQTLQQKDLLVSPSRSTYCPDEEIQIHVRFKDNTHRNLGNIKARLVKYVLFNPHVNKGKFSIKKLMKEITDNMKERTAERTINIRVPEGSPPTNSLANSVQVLYVVHVKISGYSEVKVPIKIGTNSFVDTRSYSTVLREIGIEEAEAEDFTDNGIPLSTTELRETTGWLSSNLSTTFTRPPPYIPDDVFDNLPPSYEECLNADYRQTSG